MERSSVKSLIAIAAAVFSLSAISTHALAEKAGVIHSVDYAQNTITIIDDATGQKKEFSLAKGAKAVVFGRRQSLRSTELNPGQTVILKFRVEGENTVSMK